MPNPGAKVTDAIDRISPTHRPKNQRVVMRQTWERLLFLHWQVEADLLQKMLPPELTLDVFDGKAYVGLVPFSMRNVRPVWSPSVPGLSHFPEINVRTYVHHKGSDPGVWFFSLDAENPVAVFLARALFKLPYFQARFSLRLEGDAVDYSSERRGTGAKAVCRVRYAPSGPPLPATPGTLEYFLAERYLLYSCDGANLYRGQVHHTPYPLQSVAVELTGNTLVSAAGISLSPEMETHPLLAHYAAGVSVEVFPLVRVFP
jgi:hypothetical protein